MFRSALSDLFEYLCYGSKTIINISIISALGPSLSAKRTNAIARATSSATSRGFFKYTISLLAQHTSATTCAIGNAIFFKTVAFPLPHMRGHMLRWTSRRSSGWCVDSHAIVASVIASHVACQIALALVCFALHTSESDVYTRHILTYNDGPRAERDN